MAKQSKQSNSNKRPGRVLTGPMRITIPNQGPEAPAGPGIGVPVINPNEVRVANKQPIPYREDFGNNDNQGPKPQDRGPGEE